MRQLGKRKKTLSIFRILILASFLLILTIVLVKILDLGKFVISGPKTVVNLITDTGLKSDNGRVNILLLGTGGAGHQGPDLTDTMILASIDREGRDVVLISIPRDLWAPNLSAKINTAYAYGQERKEGGLNLAKKTVQTLFGLPIHYAFRIDFRGFIKAVDLVEGIDIDVETPFVDSRYPIAGMEDDLCGLTIETEEIDGEFKEIVKDATGSAIPLDEINDQNNPFVCRYETISFSKGLTRMDGETALKFVRSRHGSNNQGSDFARSARQQKVILAFRKKVLSLETLLNPTTIIDLIKTFGKSIDTDITDSEIPLLVKLGKKIDPQSVRRLVLDQGNPESILTIGNPQDYGGQFVLVPKSESWTDFAEYIQGEIFRLEEKIDLN